ARVLFDASVRRWGDKWRVGGIADPAGLPLLALIFSTPSLFCHPDSQNRSTRHGTRSRCFRNQHFTRTGRHGKSRAETGRLSETRSNAAGRIYLFRSSQRSRTHPHGHGLESGKFASGRISKHSVNACSRRRLIVTLQLLRQLSFHGVASLLNSVRLPTCGS